jgi:multisubunit Na+/H+ antiporter MnhG subunit
VVVLLSSVLMNGNIAEVYASRMMLLLAPVSASALSRCSSLLTMRLADCYQLSGWLLGEMIFLVVVLLSSVLMNGNIAEVYASRMMLLLAPVSASALSRCSSLLTMRLADCYQLSGWLLGEMILIS